jgi:hypothetical protein
VLLLLLLLLWRALTQSSAAWYSHKFHKIGTRPHLRAHRG